jgi:hypothetical protein
MKAPVGPLIWVRAAERRDDEAGDDGGVESCSGWTRWRDRERQRDDADRDARAVIREN